MAFKITFIGLAAVLVAAALMQVGLAGASSHGATVRVSQSKLGRILVDGRGHTLYLFERDRRGRSACYGACAAYWPPLTSLAKPQAGRGVRAPLLGLSKRTDGTRQVTYAGHPLYTFIGDKRAGQTTGEGLTDFGAEWDALAASGRAMEQNASDAGATDGGYGGYGYGR